MKRYIAVIWVAVALVFVFAAGTTAADWKGAVYKMNNQLLPTGWAVAAVRVNTGMQLLAATGLLCAVFVNKVRRWAWLPAGVVMAGYTGYALIAYMDWAPYHLCACISLIDGMTWGHTLLVNTGLLALLAVSGFDRLKRQERR